VTNIGSNFLGYAEFPVSTLEGLELASENRLTDGIVVDYMVFGSRAIYPEANLLSAYSLGRTTTHEIGHFLGLRHIWGDGDCSDDDFVSDTPPTSTDHAGLGSPCTFPGPNTCGSGPSDLPDMFQNYMDYTDDGCMNLFTLEQKARMKVVLENSPRRKSLTTSKGGLPPVVVSNDAGIRNIPQSSPYLCNHVYLPEVEIRNYGTNNISEVEVRLLIDNLPAGIKTFSVSLDPLESTTLSLDAVTINVPGDHTLTYIIESVNGMADNNPDNDVESYESRLLPDADGLVNTDFENGLPAEWNILNPDGAITWTIATAPFQSAQNRALHMNFYDYQQEGEIDVWVSPVIDLTSAAGPSLTFNLAHKQYPGIEDGLMITATNLCGNPIFDSDTLYYKTGNDLATVSGSTSSPYFPESSSDWVNETIDLSDYSGEKIIINFVGINGYGNNLFLDNIQIDPGAVLSLISPGLINCSVNIPFEFRLLNNRENDINSFALELDINGSSSIYTYDLVTPLTSGHSVDVTLADLPLQEGENSIQASLVEINGTGIPFSQSNSITEVIYINNETEIVPLLQDFDDNNSWFFASGDGVPAWYTAFTNYGNSATLDFSSLTPNSPLQWLASPILDFSQVQDPYLSFDYAYEREGEEADQLLVYVSTDCGQTYSIVTTFELVNTDLPPKLPNDWKREIIPLDVYAGMENVRIALVANARMSGKLFVDNIQLFVNEPLVFAEQVIYPNPTDDGRFNITLNLTQRQQAQLRIINMQGQVILTADLPNTLNQTYPVDLSSEPAGIYIVEVQGETFSLIKRVMNTR
jgi:hypothetical protein